ncbi:HAMP domain-containing sensor histidine kinase [Pseudomonas sp. zfem002]|uniref:sensor histidine kinase n=1 Tax=Pseudomonas sp. zfem002 TaxID=3078197 RepID=UPI002928A9CF|nr:HAMP domain-containing sensor histidine kinase [Pseudomonas sp. zfem002]MDU9393141.1 HAMP domain-containing sensor histidine kinase [Pseudomonas sp. zfem002]
MARLRQSLSKLGGNLYRAKARVLIVGVMTGMVLLVFFGTIAVLRFSYISVAQQYQAAIQRTLQRVTAEFEGLEGDIAFSNFGEQSSDGRGVPVAKLPLEFINVKPGHVDDLKPLLGCSFKTLRDPRNQLCAGVLENRYYGALVYLRGTFHVDSELTSPTYAKSPFTAHHFSVAVTARGRTSHFVASFDPVRRAEASTAKLFSPAWSIAGFKTTKQGANDFTRERDIKGRILAHLTPSGSISSYEFILQLPLYAYMEASEAQSTWPPEDISQARVALKLLGPVGGGQGEVLMNGLEVSERPVFSFESMSQYLSPGESLRFITSPESKPIEVFAGSHNGRNENRSLLAQLTNAVVELVTPAIATNRSTVLSNGGRIELSGNPALVLGGWSAAAKAILVFAAVLGTLLIISGFVFYRYVLAPLNKVRRNTIYMRGRFSDADDFKLPYVISNRYDEVGVLWASIEDLHKSITTYGREALENAKKESDTLRAIGHEIRSPLQELLIRHSKPDDPSAKSLKRISYALKMLSGNSAGQSSGKSLGPKEAISASRGHLTKENVVEYLENAAESSGGAIKFFRSFESLYVSADGDMLEASLTAILNNAKEFRNEGTEITLKVFADASWALIEVGNQGPHIPFYPIDEIFEYGVSSRDSSDEHQGLGLFVAKQYIKKMGGDVHVKNVRDGVRFAIKLARAH